MLQSTKLVISYLGVLTNRKNYWIIWENFQQSQVRSFFAALCRASLNANSKQIDTSITDLRRSTHRSSVFEGQHIHLRRSTHRSSKVDTSISEGRHIVTSIFEGRHIDFRRATHRSSKVDTSIIDLRKSTHQSSKIEGGNITPTIRCRILSTTALLSLWSRRSYTRSFCSYIHV